jgi:hypothetical protein
MADARTLSSRDLADQQPAHQPRVQPTGVQRLAVRRPGGVAAPGRVPPSRFSPVPPTVTKSERPAPSFQKRRGRTTARR